VESVRPAAPADLAQCTELVRAAIEVTRTSRGGGPWLAGTAAPLGGSGLVGPHPGDLVAAWAAPGEDHRLVVGTIDDAVVGLAHARVVVGPSGALTGRIDGCYVEPGARQVGVGTALVGDLVEWAAALGCDGVDAEVLPGDRSTKALLEAAGFKARLLVLHRPLA